MLFRNVFQNFNTQSIMKSTREATEQYYDCYGDLYTDGNYVFLAFHSNVLYLL